MFDHMRDSQHTKNIQINKVIGENEKCVFYLMEKINTVFGLLNTNKEFETKRRMCTKSHNQYLSIT